MTLTLNKKVRDIAWTGAEKVLVQAVGFVQGVVLARLLAPGDFGLTAMLGIFLGLGGMLAESGLGTALVIGVKGAGPDVRRLERKILLWNVGTAIGLYGILAAAAPWIARWYGRPILARLCGRWRQVLWSTRPAWWRRRG